MDGFQYIVGRTPMDGWMHAWTEGGREGDGP